ncbi:hypothetical protein [Oleiphilus sp. HI0066]|nr:hypothetical protein [Oleiphilus sp. HI0066]
MNFKTHRSIVLSKLSSQIQEPDIAPGTNRMGVLVSMLSAFMFEGIA